jgi:hypothetical protein
MICTTVDVMDHDGNSDVSKVFIYIPKASYYKSHFEHQVVSIFPMLMITQKAT